MFLLHCVMSLVLLLLAESGVGPSDSPGSYCTESKECLQFELVCQTEEYEVRHYSPTWWVSTDAEAYLMGVGAAMAFRRLYQYITGTNQAGIQMEMTAPVLVEVPEETHTWEPALYTLSFLLPSVFQRDRPPAPINDKVYFTEMPEMDVYVRSYGGWMLSVSSRLHTHLLTKELQRVNANYNHTHHYAVGYDSPLKLLHRHNEVWYVVNGEPVCDGMMYKPIQNTTATTANTANTATATTAASPATTDPTATE
ncbi:heme-binding protein 2 isoform X2 [Ictalurus furcatus]|uniref:heme-binding protein 2 isoform X2 n=1 Tax=Ictalurus furcatus TaxID=66913 RepID=UPI002350A9CD|nr:heme-binding protein 2 isoform X2 [Ictalurus furcatus]